MGMRGEQSIYRIGVRAMIAMAAMAVMACGLEAEQTTSQGVETGDCGLWRCASNAATMAHELDASGRYVNDAGLTFVSFATGKGAPLELAVYGDQLTGHQANQFLTGASLLGAIMTVKDQSGSYLIRLDEVGSTPFWPTPVGETTPTYVFTYKTADPRDHDWKNLCMDPNPKGGPIPAWRSGDPDWKWVGRPVAVVFSGDRYDNGQLSVSTGDVAQWFNIACAGSAVAKMHLLRFTTASHDATVTTDLQRTAVLKMITDDICGIGHSFTVDGEDVLYLDWLGHHQFAFDRPQRTVEAIWTEHGASCIRDPRRRMEDPQIWDEINRICTPPHIPPHYCTDAELQAYWNPSEPRSGWGYSANP